MDKPEHLRGLVEFVAAAQAGSFSAASRALGVSVAHVSRTVRDLEQDLGIQLIHRTTRQSTLTEAGRDYYEHCRALLEGLEEARERLQNRQGVVTGVIRLSMSGHFAETRIGPLLTRFAAEHPGVRLEVEMNSRNVALVEEGFDLVIRAGPLEPPGRPATGKFSDPDAGGARAPETYREAGASDGSRSGSLSRARPAALGVSEG